MEVGGLVLYNGISAYEVKQIISNDTVLVEKVYGKSYKGERKSFEVNTKKLIAIPFRKGMEIEGKKSTMIINEFYARKVDTKYVPVFEIISDGKKSVVDYSTLINNML